MLNWPLVSHVIISPLRIPYLRLNIVLIITLTVAMLGLMYGWSDVTICKKERFFRPIYKSESKFLSERINAAKAKVSPQDMPAKMVWSFFGLLGQSSCKEVRIPRVAISSLFLERTHQLRYIRENQETDRTLERGLRRFISYRRRLRK